MNLNQRTTILASLHILGSPELRSLNPCGSSYNLASAHYNLQPEWFLITEGMCFILMHIPDHKGITMYVDPRGKR